MTTEEADPHADLIPQRLRNLGCVIEWSAAMELCLRDAFCSLVGSKYAAIVAGGQSASWLIDNCQAIVKVPPRDNRRAQGRDPGGA